MSAADTDADTDAERTFTYHRDCVLRLVLPVAPLLMAADILLVELVLLPAVSLAVKLVVHAAALASIAWIIVDYRSYALHPHRLTRDRLTLCLGARRQIEIPLDAIASIDLLPTFANDWNRRAYCKDAIRFVAPGTTEIDLRLSRDVRSARAGRRASAHVIASADDARGLIEAIRAASGQKAA